MDEVVGRSEFDAQFCPYSLGFTVASMPYVRDLLGFIC